MERDETRLKTFPFKFTLAWVVAFALLTPGGRFAVKAQETVPAGKQARDEGLKRYANGDFQGAVESLRRATENINDDPVAWNYLGLALRARGDHKSARKAFERAIKLRPDSATLRAGLADILIFLDKFSEAKKEAERAFALDPNNADANLVIGSIRLLQGSCKSAENHAGDALKNNSKLSGAYLLRSRAILCGFAAPSRQRAKRDLSADEIIAGQTRSAARFGQAAESLEKFLELAPSASNGIWKEQLPALRAYAARVDPDNGSPILSSAEVTTRARVLAKPEPEYTQSAKQSGIVGGVVLRAVFSADGTVKHLIVLNYLPHGLTENAVAAARRIRFEPATKDGRRVSMAFQLEYYFNLT